MRIRHHCFKKCLLEEVLHVLVVVSEERYSVRHHPDVPPATVVVRFSPLPVPENTPMQRELARMNYKKNAFFFVISFVYFELSY